MKKLTTFYEKEFMEICRSSKLLVCSIIFVLFGIMNPAIAKLTPWMMDMMADELKNAGMEMVGVEVDALTSWQQFFKNVPMALIIFVLMFAGILTNELQKGTLINILTKGMERWKVIISKLIVLVIVWTGGFFVCAGITYGYNAYFWDNGIAKNLGFSLVCIYLLGLWLISLIILISAFANTSAGVSMGIAGVFMASYLLGMIGKIAKYLPTKLMESSGLVQGSVKPSDLTTSIVVICICMIVNVVVAVLKFNKRNI